MGQRLNIEIYSNGDLVANSYYHWSAYTSTALSETRKIIAHTNTIKEENPVLKAIALLEMTGAQLQKGDDIERARAMTPDRGFQHAVSRNDGLIAITEASMKETRRWEEGRVTIDIDEKTVQFDVLGIDTEGQYKEYHDGDMTHVTEWDLDIDPTDTMTFDEFDRVFKRFEELYETPQKFGARLTGEYEPIIISVIE